MKFLLILVLILAPIQIYGQIYTIQVNEYQSNGWEYKVRADPFTDEIVSTQFPKMAWYLMAICTK